MTSRLFATLLVMITLWRVTRSSSACPRMCVCPKGNEVVCEAAGLSAMPQGLTAATTILDMTENNLVELTSTALQGLRVIVNLKLKHNEINMIHDGAFRSMASLQTLDLSANKLRVVHQETLRGAFSLLHLDLSSNMLEAVDGAFANMRELSRLDLRNNMVRTISQFTFRDLRNLRYLLLAGNLINHIDRRAFNNLEKLTYFSIKGNPIGGIPRFEFNSYFLQYVDMSECGLQKVPRGLPNSIRYLQLRRNNITNLARNAFHECQYVSILVLDENGLERIHEKTFSHMTYLLQLWMNKNRLKTLPASLSASLQRLLMDHNKVQNVTDVFERGSKLDEISLMGNNISYIVWDSFHKLAQLSKLDLSNNKIGQVFSNTFYNNTQLKTLLMSKNPFRNFHSRSFHGLHNLKALNLAYVFRNTSVHKNAFRDLRRLKKLDLDSSPGLVREIFFKDRLIGALRNIEELSIRSCEISSLRQDFATRMPRLQQLRISSSRWHCDTTLLWFRDWLRTTSVSVQNKDDIRCFSPQTVYGQSLMALRNSDFVRATTLHATSRTTPAVRTTRPRSMTLTSSTTLLPSSATLRGSYWLTSSTAFPRESQPKEDDSEASGSRDYVGESFDIPDEFLKDMVAKGDNYPTWGEILQRHPSYGTKHGSSYGDDVTEDNEINEHFDEYQTDVSSSSANPRHVTFPALTSGASDNTHRKGSLMLIVLATSLSCVALVLLLGGIMWCVFRRRSAQSDKSQYENAIKYQNNRKEVLYFMPNGKATSALNGNPANTKQPQQQQHAKVSKRNDSKAVADVTTPDSPNSEKEKMALVPGRDINHEGPLRIYKWEDF